MMSSNNESPPTIAAANLAELLAIIQQQEQIQRGVRLQQDSIRMQSLLDPNGRGTQSTIILPVAHHQALDQALVQIIGPPQTVCFDVKQPIHLLGNPCCYISYIACLFSTSSVRWVFSSVAQAAPAWTNSSRHFHI